MAAQIFAGTMLGLICLCGCSAASSPLPLEETRSTLAALSSTTSTSTNLASNLYFPQQAPVSGPRIVMEALLFGQLVERDDCLRVIPDAGTTSYLIVWPPNVRLHVQGDILQVVDDTGAERFQVGQHVRLSGGAIKDAAGVESRQPLRRALPPACSGPYWIVGEEMSKSGGH